MTSTYRTQFQVKDEYLDEQFQLKTSALLYFVQEAAGQHAALLGTDWGTLQSKNLFWAIIRHRVRITRLPMASAGTPVLLTVNFRKLMPDLKVLIPRALKTASR